MDHLWSHRTHPPLSHWSCSSAPREACGSHPPCCQRAGRPPRSPARVSSRPKVWRIHYECTASIMDAILYIYICIYIYYCMYIYVYIYILLYVYIYICIYILLYVYIYIYQYIYYCMCIYIYIIVCIYIYICVYIYIYYCMYIYVSIYLHSITLLRIIDEF